MRSTSALIARIIVVVFVLTTLISTISFSENIKAQDSSTDLPKIIRRVEFPIPENSKSLTLSYLDLLLDKAKQNIYYESNGFGGFSSENKALNFSAINSVNTQTLKQKSEINSTYELIFSSAIDRVTDDIYIGASAPSSDPNQDPFSDTPSIKKYTPATGKDAYVLSVQPQGAYIRDILIDENPKQLYALTSAVVGPEGGVGTILSIFDTATLKSIADPINIDETWASIKTDHKGNFYAHGDTNVAILDGMLPEYKDYIQVFDSKSLKLGRKVDFGFEILDLEVEENSGKIFLVAQKPDNSLWLEILNHSLSIDSELMIKGPRKSYHPSGQIILNPNIGKLYFWEPRLDAPPGLTVVDYEEKKVLGTLNEGVVSIAVDTDTSLIYAVAATLNKATKLLDTEIIIFQDTPPDTDGDGLPNLWETNGVTIDPGDGSGPQFIDLKAMGTDPNKPDIFVQADWMVGLLPGQNMRPKEEALRIVHDAFANGPRHINLHIDNGPDSIMIYETTTNPDITWGKYSRAKARSFVGTLGTLSKKLSGKLKRDMV